jgi:hypothetical protein
VQPTDPMRYIPVYMRPFVGVAMQAHQRHIRQRRLATSRPWQDMVDLKATDLQLYGQLTVFAAVASPPHDCVSQWVPSHAHASGNMPGSAVCRRSRATRASSCSIARRWAKSTSARNASCPARTEKCLPLTQGVKSVVERRSKLVRR